MSKFQAHRYVYPINKHGRIYEGHISIDDKVHGNRTLCGKSVAGWEVKIKAKKGKMKTVKRFIPDVDLCRRCQSAMATHLTGISPLIDKWEFPVEKYDDDKDYNHTGGDS